MVTTYQPTGVLATFPRSSLTITALSTHPPSYKSTKLQLSREWPLDVVAYSRRFCHIGIGVSNYLIAGLISGIIDAHLLQVWLIRTIPHKLHPSLKGLRRDTARVLPKPQRSFYNLERGTMWILHVSHLSL